MAATNVTPAMDVGRALKVIGHVRHDSLAEAKGVLAVAAERLARGQALNLDVPACSGLLWRKGWEFRVQGAPLDAEFHALTEVLRAASDRSDHQAEVLHAEALWLFETHGSKQAAEAQQLMEQAAQKCSSYKAYQHHVPVGVAAEEATQVLFAGDGAPLFYLLLQQYADASWEHPPSPWLLRAVCDTRFWAWLNQQTKRPPVPSEYANLDVDRLFTHAPTKLKNLSWWKSWPSGRREVLAMLQLLAPTNALPVDAVFTNMAAVGDTDAMVFLAQPGVEAKVISRAAKQAALHGEVDSLYCLNELGLNPRGKSGALRSVCREREAPASHRVQPRMGELPERADGAVIDALIAMGAAVKLDKALALALDSWRKDAVACLLRHGADADVFRAFIKAGGAPVERSYARHPATAHLFAAKP